MVDNVINIEDYIGRYVELTSIKGNVVLGIIYRKKDCEALIGGILLDFPYVIVESDWHIYSFSPEDVKNIEVVI